ncbi:DUF6263 family protein [Corynebacterium hadale]
MFLPPRTRSARPASPAHRARFAAACLALSATLLPLTACGTADEDPLEGIPAFAMDTPVVEVVAAGESPQQLSYRLNGEGDAAWDTTVAVSSGISQDVLPADQAHEDPGLPNVSSVDVSTTTLPLAVTAGSAPEPGEDESPADAAVEFTVGKGKHSDLPLSQEVASAEGFLMRWRAQSTGAISTLKLMAPNESQERGRQAVEQSLLAMASMNVVLPDEPVGVGGSWTVRNRVTGTSNMLRTATYTVTRLEGDAVDLDVHVEERPTQQSLQIDNSVAGDLDGQTLDVESTSTTSQGSITLDLKHPLPTTGQVASTTRLVYSGEDAAYRVVQDVTEAVTYGSDDA